MMTLKINVTHSIGILYVFLLNLLYLFWVLYIRFICSFLFCGMVVYLTVRPLEKRIGIGYQ